MKILHYLLNNKDFINKEDFNIKNKREMPILAIKLSDFNKLRSMVGYKEIDLKDDEFTMQWAKSISVEEIHKFIDSNSNLKVNNKEFKISQTPYYTESIGEGIYNFLTSAIIILPDKICEKLTLAGLNFYANTKEDMSYDEAIFLENKYIKQWLNNNYKYLMDKYDSDGNEKHLHFIDTRVKVAEISEILNVTISMRMLGIYLGTVLLMISLTVLALQQLSDSIEHRERFNILKKLGIDDHEINKLVLKQISIYFIIPIVITIIGFLIFIYNYILIYKNEINSYIGDKAFMINILVAIIIIISIYICYFIATYYAFKRNIKDMKY